MLTNDQMTKNRYGRMYNARKLYNGIMEELDKGLRIQVTTHTTSKIYSQTSQFKLGKYSVYVSRGNNWDCIDYASVRSVR